MNVQTGNTNGTAQANVSPSAQATSSTEQQATRNSTTVPAALVQRLNQPLPDSAITPHPSKSYLSSIKTIYQIERLNQVFGLGGWTAKSEIIENDPAGGMIVMRVTLQVPAYGIELEQYGGNDNEDRGDAYKGAFTDALGKLCGYLGIGIDVYKGDGPTKSNGGRRKPAAPPVAQPKPAASSPTATTPDTPPAVKPWKTVGEMRRLFQQVREQIGETLYLEIMEQYKARSVEDFLTMRPVDAATNLALRCYTRMLEIRQEAA